MSTKLSISKELSRTLKIPLHESKHIFDFFFQKVVKHAKVERVKISGFGTFYYKKSRQRIGRNPKTKESYIIHPMNKIVFAPSNKVKKNLNL